MLNASYSKAWGFLNIHLFWKSYANLFFRSQFSTLCIIRLDDAWLLVIIYMSRYHWFVWLYEHTFPNFHSQVWSYLKVSDVSHNSSIYVIQEDFRLEEMISPSQLLSHANIQNLFSRMIILEFSLSINVRIDTQCPYRNNLQPESTFFPR